MSEEKAKYQTEPKQADKQPGTGFTAFDLSYDTEERDAMVLTVPLKKVAEDDNINGLIFLLGFFEHAKAEAIATVKVKRARLQAEKLTKGNLILPGQQPTMRVH